MGMYTELVLKSRVKDASELDENTIETLEWLFNGGVKPNVLPNSKFFNQGSRLESVTKSNSFYHIPWSDSKYARDKIFSRADLKNYSDEIELFLEWLVPHLELYVDYSEEKCIGWVWYEEELAPSLIMVNNEGVITYK